TRCRSERASAPGVVLGRLLHLLMVPQGARMHSTRGRLTGAVLVAAATVAFMAGAPQPAPSDLRVCADPYDMPFSNSQEEGFENKIAHLVARDLNASAINAGGPSRRGGLGKS